MEERTEKSKRKSENGDGDDELHDILDQEGIASFKSGAEQDPLTEFIERLERVTKTPHGSFSDLLKEEMDETPESLTGPNSSTQVMVMEFYSEY